MANDSDYTRLGPVRAYFIFHIFDNALFWLGLFAVLVFNSESIGRKVYDALSTAPWADGFASFYAQAVQNEVGWWGLLLIGLSIIASFVRYKVTRFAVEKGVLIISRGKFGLNPLSLFQKLDYTVALNLIYDVDVKRTLFQYIFGGGDVYVRTAANDIFHLEFVENPDWVREYFIEHSGIRNKPVIGIY